MLYKAIKQMESSVKLAQIQTEYQFRPWIGTSQRFQRIELSINDQIQFEVIVKNFGELPASTVNVKFISDNKMINRQDVISKPESKFVLGQKRAGWWSEGLLSDVEFVNAIKFLIQQEIIIYNVLKI